MSDFLRNYKEHVARIKETRTPEVLTVNGRAEVVMLDTETYENLMERLHSMEAIASIRAEFERERQVFPTEAISPEEMDRRKAVMHELMAETIS